MSLAIVHLRITELQQLLQPAPVPAPTAPSFAGTLQGAMGPLTATTGAAPVAAAAAAPSGVGQAILNAVAPEVGVAEQPPGSNDSPRIAQYRQATAGSGVGPWCAYFVSWAARQAGTPIGDAGQGYGRVDDVYAWAQRTGKAIDAGQGTPQPGDLIVWDEHIGIVERVDPDGSVHTIEGNSSDMVARRDYGSDGGGALGYVRLG